MTPGVENKDQPLAVECRKVASALRSRGGEKNLIKRREGGF